jgi:hypothetical protein
MHQPGRVLSIAVLLLSASLSPVAQAAVFCATTTAQLEFALDQADSNGQDDEIRIAQGTIAVPQTDSFSYEGGSTFSGDDNDLTISGGWVPRLGNPCGLLPPDAHAFDTVLTGEDRERIMQIFVGNQSNVTISGITFTSAASLQEGRSPGGALYLGTAGEIAGTFTVVRSAFIANRANLSAAFYTSRSTTVRFMNNLVFANTSVSSSAAVGIVQNDENGVYVVNNTILNNLSENDESYPRAAGLRIFISGSSQALVANNILWGNDNADINYDGNGFFTARNNNIDRWIGLPDVNEDNISIAPMFESGGFFNFNLVPESPQANAGLNPPRIPLPFFESNWSLPESDLQGHPRLTNASVDIGAFETAQDGIFSDRFN